MKFLDPNDPLILALPEGEGRQSVVSWYTTGRALPGVHWPVLAMSAYRGRNDANRAACNAIDAVIPPALHHAERERRHQLYLAQKARGIMEIRQAQDQYWAMGVRVRSAARLARAELLTAKKTVTYYERAILPQQARLLTATTQQYNAMQEDVLRLIRAKREQIQAGRGYIDALRAYWRARSNYQQLKSGRLPDGGGGAIMVASAGAGGGEEGGH